MIITLSSSLEQDVPLFTADGSMFYTILAAKQGARGEFHHIASLSAQVSGRWGWGGVTDDSHYTAQSSLFTMSSSPVITEAICLHLFSP